MPIRANETSNTASIGAANGMSGAGDVTSMVYVNVQNSLPAAHRPYHFYGDTDGLLS